jgi:molybdopterin synthase sulfur carrier subunit
VRVQLFYFAWVREATGVDGEILDLPETLITLADLAGWLAQKYPVFADTTRLRAAIDQQIAPMDTPIAGASEIAFFPPVTGG